MADRYVQIVESTDNVATVLPKIDVDQTVPVPVGDKDRTIDIVDDVAFGQRIALDGTIFPFGGPKGTGLAVAVEGARRGLVGTAMAEDVTGTSHRENPCTKGDLFIALEPSVLSGSDFAERPARSSGD